jgi:hypothetical protein
LQKGIVPITTTHLIHTWLLEKDDNKSPGYYVYEVFMNHNDQKAKQTRIKQGEFLIKVYNQFKMAKLLKSNN